MAPKINDDATEELDVSITRPEPKWAKAISSVPEPTINIMFALMSLLSGAIGFVGIKLRVVLVVIVVVIFLAGSLLSYLKHARDEDMDEIRDKELDQAIEKERQAYKDVIAQMSTSVYYLASVVGSKPKAEMDKELSLLRQRILEIVRHQLGPQTGVQANLFTVSSIDPPELTAAKWGSAGGRNGQTSDRKFSPGDTTYKFALDKLSRFVSDVSELDEKEHPARPYKTFATHPVSTDDNLYGILTIDAPNPNDISDLDVDLLAFFAGILTATFTAEKSTDRIPRRKRGENMK